MLGPSDCQPKNIMAQITYTLKLIEAKQLTPSVKHFVFEREDGTIPRFQPGQFITLHIPTTEGKKVHRSYSLANAPSEENRLELSAAYIEGGIASTLLFNLKPGGTVTAIGPHGLFVLKDEKPPRYILVATGTGVTPYRSMLTSLEKRLRDATHPLTVELILGVRTREDALFKSEFLAFAKANPQFRFRIAYSRETGEGLDPNFETTGHVQQQFKHLSLNPTQDIIYLCGNPSMIDEAFSLLTEQHGFDRKAIRREKYAFAH